MVGIVTIYILGHFIATISHITIDRIVVGTILKYPYLTLLDISDEERKIAWPMHKLILVLLFGIWTLSILTIFYPTIQINVIISVYAILIIVLMRLVLVLVKGTFPSVQSYKININSWWYLWLFAWHSKLIDSIIINPIRQLLAIDKGFSKELASKIKIKIEDRFGVDCNKIGSDNFWLPCLENLKNPEYNTMSNNWLHLYSLNRNICMAFVLLSGFMIFNHYLVHYNVSKSEQAFMVISIIGAASFGIRYVMLYFTYYSKNVFRFFYIEKSDNLSKSRGGET